MSMSLNQCNFVGRIGADPLLKQTINGTALTRLSLAIPGRWPEEQGKQVAWMPIFCFDKLSEIAQEYLSKGDNVFITGELFAYKPDLANLENTKFAVRATRVLRLSSPKEGKSELVNGLEEIGQYIANAAKDEGLDNMPY